MQALDVYAQYDISPVRGRGAELWDAEGRRYLDFYGGHAVISIGHSHPQFVEALRAQIERLVFYSNAVRNPVQDALARLLGEVSGCEHYRLFLCNSGAEANENALKLASFHNGRSAVVALRGAFHGRSSAAVQVTDNPALRAAINQGMEVRFVAPNTTDELEQAVRTDDVAAVIIEGMQGVEGVIPMEDDYLRDARLLCDRHGAALILDEVQSGYGRTGSFFAFQHAGIEPDLVTIAKGMGNGVPVGGVLVHPSIRTWRGQLGSTFGGNHLACAAAIAVLEVLRAEGLIAHAERMGAKLRDGLSAVPGVRELRGRGLMLGLALDGPAAAARAALLGQHGIFTGSATRDDTLRLLPPLTIGEADVREFLTAFDAVCSSHSWSANA